MLTRKPPRISGAAFYLVVSSRLNRDENFNILIKIKHKEHQEGTKVTKIKTIIKTLCPLCCLCALCGYFWQYPETLD